MLRSLMVNAPSLLLFLYLHISFKTFFLNRMEYYTTVKWHLQIRKLRIWKLPCKVPQQRIRPAQLFDHLKFYRLLHRPKEEQLWRMINMTTKKYRARLVLKTRLNSKSKQYAAFTTQKSIPLHARTISWATFLVPTRRLLTLIKSEL